ncbi:acyl carrier protein [Peptostreptococcus stomatis]
MISNDIKNIKNCIKKEIIKMITKIKEILADQLDIELEDIKDDSDIQEDLEADSLDVMDIMTEIEDEFDIEVEDEAIEELRTPQKIAEYIEKVK